MRFWYFVIAAGLGTGALFAQAYTVPKGIYTVRVAGKPEGASQARTYLGIQLLPEPRFAGLIASVNGKAFSLNNLPAPNQVEDPDRESYLHVQSGNGTGFIAISRTFGQLIFSPPTNSRRGSNLDL